MNFCNLIYPFCVLFVSGLAMMSRLHSYNKLGDIEYDEAEERPLE